jgi:hypothetical protein
MNEAHQRRPVHLPQEREHAENGSTRNPQVSSGVAASSVLAMIGAVELAAASKTSTSSATMKPLARSGFGSIYRSVASQPKWYAPQACWSITSSFVA